MAVATSAMLDDQKVQATLSFANAAGNAGSVPAGVVPTWAVDNAAICTIDGSADPTGLTVMVVAAGALGVANVTATAVVNGATLSATGQVTVTADGNNLVMTMTFGTPVSK